MGDLKREMMGDLKRERENYDTSRMQMQVLTRIHSRSHMLLLRLIAVLSVASAFVHPPPQRLTSSLQALKTATFGAGCFWAPAEKLSEVKGVKSAVAGYAGDESVASSPSYAQVCAGKTKLVEAVRVEYDDDEIGYDELLEEFREANTAEAGNKRQYMGVIFVADEKEEASASSSVSKSPSESSYIAVEPATAFWKAEGYHQDYWPKWKKRIPFALLLLVGSSNPGEVLPPAAQSFSFYAYLAGILLAVLERKLDNKVTKL